MATFALVLARSRIDTLCLFVARSGNSSTIIDFSTHLAVALITALAGTQMFGRSSLDASSVHITRERHCFAVVDF